MERYTSAIADEKKKRFVFVTSPALPSVCPHPIQHRSLLMAVSSMVSGTELLSFSPSICKKEVNSFSEPSSLFDLSTPRSTDRRFSMCFSLSVLLPEVNKNWGLYCKFHKGRASAEVCCKISCMVRETLSEQYIPWVLSTLLAQRFLYILFYFLNSLVSAPGSWKCWWS